jgi:hypothetical protein
MIPSSDDIRRGYAQIAGEIATDEWVRKAAEAIDARLHDCASPPRTAIIAGVLQSCVNGLPFNGCLCKMASCREDA